jgi:hypothetical protein
MILVFGLRGRLTRFGVGNSHSIESKSVTLTFQC